MSDDRFKQARRSLIDRNNQRRQQDDDGMADDDFYEDEKTLMVSIDSMTTPPPSQPAQAPPPARHAPPAEDDFEDAATQMVDISEFQAPGGGFEERTDPRRKAFEPAGQQQFGPGGGAGMGAGAGIGAGAAFVPDSDVAGHEGHTDFINIEELSAQGANFGSAPGSGGIMNDPVLTQGYQFGPQSIQEGEITLIFAQNPLGKPVVLRRIWSEDPNAMPAEWRQRLSQLEGLKVPGLVALNGVLASQSGVWAEMAKPEGYRLSAVLEQHGPQSPEHVSAWLKQCAEVLEAVHGAGLLYLNMNLDALWIQEDNSIVVEPFDLLSFENRGHLDDFGPMELKRPPQDRQLTPATDIYSLAAVGTAALTGLPLAPQSLDAIDDKKLVRQLRKGLAANPVERPQTMQEFAAKFKGPSASGSGESKLNFDLSEIDIKVVAAIAVLLLGGFAGYMFWNKQQAEKAAAERQRIEASQLAAEAEEIAGQPGGAGGGAAANPAGAPPAGGAPAGNPTAAAPAGIVNDARLQVLTSYQVNPPSAEAEAVALSPEELETESSTLLERARAHIASGDKLAPGKDQLDEYRSALESVTASIRLHKNKPTEAEQELLSQLHDKKTVRDYQEKQRERINKAIDSDNIGGATRSYKTLTTLDYRAESNDFFLNNPNARVRVLSADAAESPE